MRQSRPLWEMVSEHARKKQPLMPRVNPETSFEASARHLFRHINDLSALSMNPLLRSYFAIARRESGSALKEIHAQILMHTDALCEELDAKGLRLQARPLSRCLRSAGSESGERTT
jgi:hypothetical protein